MTFWLAYIGGKLLAVGKWLVTNWRISLIVVALCLVAGVGYWGCQRLKPKPKIDLGTVEKLNNAAYAERQQELRNTVEKNQDTIETVDGRTELQNVHNVDKIAEIDAKVKEVDQKIMESKSQGRDVTQTELECLLVPKSCQQ